jgi:hypothetical protein
MPQPKMVISDVKCGDQKFNNIKCDDEKSDERKASNQKCW